MLPKVNKCDWIWENDLLLLIWRSIKITEMIYRSETFRDDKGIVVLQSLKVSHLSVIPDIFYELPKLKNWMFKLCTFPKSGHEYNCIDKCKS